MPLGDGHFAAHGNTDGLGKQLIGHPDVPAPVGQSAYCPDTKAVSGPIHLDLGPRILAQQRSHGYRVLSHRVPELLAVGAAGITGFGITVQKRGVGRIDTDLKRLKPVALQMTFECKGVFFRGLETIHPVESRRLALAQESKNDPVTLHAGVIRGTDVIEIGAALGLTRLFQTLAAHVEQPAVKRTTDTAVFEAAVTKVRTPVRTVSIDQAQTTLLVPEKNQSFSKHRNTGQRSIPGKLFSQRHRLPVAPQQPTSWRTRTGPGGELILFCGQHSRSSCARAFHLETLPQCSRSEPDSGRGASHAIRFLVTLFLPGAICGEM